MSKIKVAVLFGGMSNEHDISLISAANIMGALSPEKYDVIPVGITKKGRWLFYPGEIQSIISGSWDFNPDCTPAVLLPDPMYKGIAKLDGEYSIDKIDAVIPALHGKNCEDGVIQGLLELSGVPYVGCGVLASANCMDKIAAHTILEAGGVKMAKWRMAAVSEISRLDEICAEIAEDLGYPLFVKPANSGSSIGISKAENFDGLKSAVKTAFSHDKRVIIEEYIDGRELECAVLDDGESIIAAGPGEINPCNDFYDYDAKYVSDSNITVPAVVDENTASEMKGVALKAFGIMGCSGLARIDFFLKGDGTVILNEINTFPGFTEISMYPKLMEHIGIPLDELLDRLISEAINRRNNA